MAYEVYVMHSLLNISGYAQAFLDKISAFFESVKNSFSDFHPILDTLDILCIAAAVFFLIRLLRGKRAVALLIGFAVVGILTALAEFFGLKATGYIFGSALDLSILLILILFMPEIREALEKIGAGFYSKIVNIVDQKKHTSERKNAIDNICSAVSNLSSTKTGALIVITRTTKFNDIVSRGTTLNADISSDLLRNIFFKNSPLHDGAVIIDDWRISAAGCILPNTTREIDSELGTRHRAAIGLSEHSDAIVIVVSEETGIISIACDYALTRNFDIDTLKRFLKGKLLRSSDKDSES